MSISPLFILLQQEAHIVRSCLLIGLNEIRNANIGERGRFYTAFYQLSIGLERALKLVLILDHMVTNDLVTPDSQSIRGFGHDIISLMDACEAVAINRSYSFASDFQLEQINLDILAFLSEFALGARYANLDALASGSTPREPFVSWGDILSLITVSDVPSRTIRKVINEGSVLAPKLENVLLIRTTNLDATPLTLEEWLTVPRLHEHASRYAVLRIAAILNPVIELIIALSDDAKSINDSIDPQVAHIPYMRDFFRFFYFDRRYILRKKRWP